MFWLYVRLIEFEVPKKMLRNITISESGKEKKLKVRRIGIKKCDINVTVCGSNSYFQRADSRKKPFLTYILDEREFIELLSVILS